MNAKHEKSPTGPSANADEQNIIRGAGANAPELTEVTDKEMDRVEGGYGIGTRTGDGPFPIFRRH
jgi:hypothetical protein